MIAIRRYLVFIICLAELTLSFDEIFKEEGNFLNYILELHNSVRSNHGAHQLKRYSYLDEVASSILNGNFNNIHGKLHQYGTNIKSRMYDTNTKLNAEEANELFAEWYYREEDYNYCLEPLNNDADEFTQIVWKDTLGIGLALMWDNGIYTVQVVYEPCGNIQGQYRANVLQPPIIAQALDNQQNFFKYEKASWHFLNYIFDLHNEARRNHQVEYLERDYGLDMSAKQILDDMESGGDINLGKKKAMNCIHRSYNIYTRLDAAEAEAVFSEWYKHGNGYNYEVEPSNYDAAEFTQIVWRGTKSFGIAMERKEGYYKVVALYSPKGNIYGKYENNVKRPRILEQGGSSGNN